MAVAVRATVLIAASIIVGVSSDALLNISSVTFLVTVNHTYWSPQCIKTVKTSPVRPNVKSESILVGDCDEGPIEYSLSWDERSKNWTLGLTFHSSVIMDASPPTCSIEWSGEYFVPRTMDWQRQTLLPGCSVMDSREGYHLTSYWFYLLEWSFS